MAVPKYRCRIFLEPGTLPGMAGDRMFHARGAIAARVIILRHHGSGTIAARPALPRHHARRTIFARAILSRRQASGAGPP